MFTHTKTCNETKCHNFLTNSILHAKSTNKLLRNCMVA